MKFDLLIKNGLVILANGEVKADVAVKNGKIAAIGKNLNDAKEVVDAEGLIVSPGMIDAHVHITEPGGGYRDDWEGYVTGTNASAKGGVTTFIEMPLNQIPATVNRATLATKISESEGKLAVDVASLGGLVPYNLDGGIQELDEDGVVGFKCFMASCGNRGIEGDFMNVDDYSLFVGMKQIAKTGKVLAIHAENPILTDRLGEEAIQKGNTSLSAYMASRPVFTEVEAIRRAIFFAKETGCSIHIVHITSPQAVEEVTRARREGVNITCETCTHYLYFDDSEVDAIGPVVKCSPPIRNKENQRGLWEKLLGGEIDFVTSDHSPCPSNLKETKNAFEAWGGISGLQNNVDILFDEGVQKRGLTLSQFAMLIAGNPAKRFGLSSKGQISIGKDADFVLIKPNTSYILQAEDLEYRNKISPYIGRKINALVVKTILRGHKIYTLENGVEKVRFGKMI